jgi:hypothetical protein
MLSRCLFVTTTVVALIAELAYAQDVSFGQRIFHEKADCQFCHGVDGDGRGDPRSPGRASDLRKTFLTREQLIDVITCGRPSTQMPDGEPRGSCPRQRRYGSRLQPEHKQHGLVAHVAQLGSKRMSGL